MTGARAKPEVGEAVARPSRLGWLFLTIAILFGLFYVYDLFEAISNVVGKTDEVNLTNKIRALVDQPLVSVPWGLLAVDLLLPPVTYVTAFLLARRLSSVAAALVFLIGLTAVSAMTLTIVALA
jgi:hypothetical protein